MRLEDLGIDVKTGHHRKNPLTLAESKFLGILWVDHVGIDNRISAIDLAALFSLGITVLLTPEELEELPRRMRDMRKMQNHLLFDHNIPVLSKAGNHGGYWIAANEVEASEFYNTFRKRGLTGLVKASRGKQSAMVDMVTQLSFQFEELVDKTDATATKTQSSMPTPIEVVDAFFKKMLENPEEYAEGLRKIGDKYGSVLVPKGRFDAMIEAMKAKTMELHELVASLEG